MRRGFLWFKVTAVFTVADFLRIIQIQVKVGTKESAGFTVPAYSDSREMLCCAIFLYRVDRATPSEREIKGTQQ